MSNIQKHQNLTPEIENAFKPEVLNVIRNSFAPNATEHEFMLFAHKAASYGLDPFKNEIFFIKYGQTVRIQFAAEAYLTKAREKEGFEPPNTQMIHENDEVEMNMNAETGSMEIVNHKVTFPRGKIIAAYSVAYRKGYRPVTAIVDVDEVSHMFTGQNKDNWNKWTQDMLGKYVQQRSLKKQYGLEFDDVTLEGNQEPEMPKERRDITHEVDSYQESQSAQPDPQPEPEEPPKETTDEKRERLRQEIADRFQQLNITDKNQQGEYIAKNARVEQGKKPTIAQMEGLIKAMDMQIEMQEDAAADDSELPE